MSTNPYQSPDPEPDCPVVRLPWRCFWQFLLASPVLKYTLLASFYVGLILLLALLVPGVGLRTIFDDLEAGLPWSVQWCALGIVLAAIVAGPLAAWLAWRQELRRISQELHYLSTRIAENPTHANLLVSRAQIYSNDTGQLDLAIADLSRAIELEPASWELYDLRADAYLEMDDCAAAGNDRTMAIVLLADTGELSGEHWHLYANRSLSHYLADDFQRALEDTGEALRLLETFDEAQPFDFARLHYERAMCHRRLGDRAAARQEFKAAHRYDRWWHLEPRKALEGLPAMLLGLGIMALTLLAIFGLAWLSIL